MRETSGGREREGGGGRRRRIEEDDQNEEREERRRIIKSCKASPVNKRLKEGWCCYNDVSSLPRE